MDAVWWALLVAGRVLPGIVLIPAFGGRRVPLPAQLGLAACAVLLVFERTGFAGATPDGMRWVALLGKELAVGAVLALAASCPFAALRIAGQLVDDLRGASRTEVVEPTAGGRASPLAVLHLLLACVVFFELGGPVRLVEALGHSYTALPVAAFPDGPLLQRAGELALALTGAALRLGVELAWPAAAAVLAADVVLGFVNRSAPQLQVFFLGLPLRLALGAAAAALCLEPAADAFAGFWAWLYY